LPHEFIFALPDWPPRAYSLVSEIVKNQVELNGGVFVTVDFTIFPLPLETTHVKKANFDTSMTSKDTS
jgi:hypothetical protein